MSQLRGGDASGEKCRVTMEFRQGVSGYFANGKEEVKGHILPSVLVLKGAYGILTNINDNHYFKEKMVFKLETNRLYTRVGKVQEA